MKEIFAAAPSLASRECKLLLNLWLIFCAHRLEAASIAHTRGTRAWAGVEWMI